MGRLFHRLQTKLTVLYAGLFAIAVGLVGLTVYSAIAGNAQRTVDRELAATGQVFDQVWALRTQRLRDGAELISRDFGFREAVATHDEATIRSALANLQARLGVDTAFILGVDGETIGIDAARIDGGAERLWATLDAQPDASGVFVIGDVTYQAVSAPIMAPTLTGWVVFAARLDQGEMQALQKLASIPLEARVYDRRGGRWMSSVGRDSAADQQAMARVVDRALKSPAAGPQRLNAASGDAIALVKPLNALNDDAPAALLLRYPMAQAMAPYRPLLATTALAGLAGAILLIFGSWLLARSLTRPITALDHAAQRLRDGEDVTVAIETSDEIGRLAQSFNDMAAGIREREAKITHLALHDAETDLPNRRALERDVDASLRAGAPRVVVAALGVDRFQHIRGAIGYGLTTRLMAELGARLSRRVAGARAAQLTTSTLGLIVPASDEAEAERLLADLVAVIEAPILLGGDAIDIHVSIGIAAATLPGDVSAALERAMIGLDQARAGHRKVAVFDAEAYGDPSGNLSLISEMMQAIDQGHLLLHHQPKLDLRAGAVTGVEALVRWKHPTRGMLRPDLFIGMAEETGYIAPLTDWVLDRAIADQATLREAGHDVLMSVNLSGRLMSDPGFASSAIERMQRANARLCLEITETAVIDNPDMALAILAEYSAAGALISIDDYGSGLSSLTYLKQIRADELKIDKSFVLSLSESQRDALLVKSTIDLAHSLGMKVTAEGVETAQALALLTAMGCDIAQGYHIARPLPLDDLMASLAHPPATQAALSA